MGEVILLVEQLGKSYGKQIALSDISLGIRTGEILGIAGENGAGKSTLLSLLATAEKPSQGTISFHGENIQSRKRQYREKIGYVPQEIALFEELSGLENLQFFGKAYQLKKAELEERVCAACEITEFPTEALKRPLKTYSGGMKRKINIGAALLHHPEILFLDEPVANLDLEAEEQVLGALRQLARQGMAIVYAGHQMEQMEQLCASVCFLKKGRQVCYGTMKELLYQGGETVTLKQVWKETAGKVSNKE